MKLSKIASLILFIVLVFSGCSSKNETNTTTNDIPKNVITAAVPDAEKVPHLFYQYLNDKQYDNAIKLLGSNLKFQGEPSMRKYLENIQHTEFIEFKDITSNGGFLDDSQQKCYSVKIYYAVLRIQVKDKKLVPDLLSDQYRRMVVVKLTKDSPWLLDADEGTDKGN